MWELDCEEGWAPKSWCFWTVVLEKTLESPLDCKEIHQSILKEISPGVSLEEMMLRLELQYFGHLIWRVNSLEKILMLGEIAEKRTAEDEIAGYHHQLDGREFEWTLGVGDGQGGLACCDSWGRKESDTTERLNWADIIFLHPTIWHCSMFRAHINNASMKNFCTYLENICFYPRYRSKSRIEGNVWDQL